MCCFKSLLGELGSSCVILLGEDYWKIVPSFPWTSPHMPFLCAHFVLYPFAIINHSYGCYSTQSPVCFARESLNLGMVLGTHPHRVGVRSGIEKNNLIWLIKYGENTVWEKKEWRGRGWWNSGAWMDMDSFIHGMKQQLSCCLLWEVKVTYGILKLYIQFQESWIAG